METQKNRRLAAADLDEIRASVDWQRLFEGLDLQKCDKKSKPDDWWAYSPFHEENEPSFHMGPGGQWYDFSIGEGGGALELIQKLRGGNCYEAGHYLLDQGWAGGPLKATTGRQAERSRKQAKAVLAEASTPNPVIRQDLLPLTGYNEYLEQRGLSEELCDELGIGCLEQGRSPLRGRVIFQLRDARMKGKRASKKEPVILSHIGRAVSAGQEPKYLFYEGFQKSAELLGQDRCWLDEPTIEQIKAAGFIVLTEGPFDWAKAIQAGLRNVVASLGAQLAVAQAQKLKELCQAHGVEQILIAFDRDDAGRIGAEKARDLLSANGIVATIFDWEAVLGQQNGRPISIPSEIGDLADLSSEQLQWLRRRQLL